MTQPPKEETQPPKTKDFTRNSVPNPLTLHTKYALLVR